MRLPILFPLFAILLISSALLGSDAPSISKEQLDADLKAGNNFNATGFDFQIADGPVKPNAQSLGANYSCPDWFRDAKFGIYMHWGLNSVAGFNGHYGRHMYHQQEPEESRMDKAANTPMMSSLSGYKPGSEDVYGYHVKTFGHPTKFGYKDLIPLWKADKFDPSELAALYRECGAKFVGVMAVHHDNFDLYDSTYQPWNSLRMGPKIDIVGAWKKACAKEHLRFAISSHLSNGFHEHAFYQGNSDTAGPLAGLPYDTMDHANDGLYGTRTADRLRRLNPGFAQQWYHRTKELVDKYNPDLLYLDGGLPNGDYGLNLAAHFYNHYLAVNGKKEGVFTIKKTTPAGFTLDVESAGSGEGRSAPWMVDTSINPGWFYLGKESEEDLKSVVKSAKGGDDAGMSATEVSRYGPDRIRLNAGQVIRNLVDIVSKNGNMMLNVGLRPDGSLPETYRHELLDIGSWLKVNGEAIYATRPFSVYGEGPFTMPATEGFTDNDYHFTAADIRFTRSKDGKTLYAILMDWPSDNAMVTIKSVGSKALPGVAAVSMLATGEPLKWTQDPAGLHVTLPAKAPGEHAYVVKVALAHTGKNLPQSCSN